MGVDAHRPFDPATEYDMCWAGEGILVCDKQGDRDRLGLCESHYEWLTRG